MIRLILSVVSAALTLCVVGFLSAWLPTAARDTGWAGPILVLSSAAVAGIYVWTHTRSRRQQLRTGAVLGALVLPVPLWGYWHTTQYGDLWVTVHDVAGANDRQLSEWLRTGDLEFKDDAGRPLAKGSVDNRMTHPTLGDCRAAERQGGAAWQQCFAAHSRWFMTWVSSARRATVRVNACTIDNVPVVVDESKGLWWLWWVPHPHLDNSARTHFRVTLWIDSAKCTPAAARF